MLIQQYNEMWAKLQAGEITQQQWVQFCTELLAEIMEGNRDVFVRLKHR